MINLRVAVTGSSGFIGKNYSDSAKKIFSDFFSISREELKKFDYSKVDVVVHFAAIAHTKGVTSEEYYSVNRDLTLEIAFRAKEQGVKQFIFLSSTKVYGDESGLVKPYSLNDLPFPKDDYGLSKLEAEEGLKKLQTESFCVSIIRSPLVYGPRIKANMLGLMKLVSKFPLLPFGNTNNKRSFIYVENLNAFINRIIELKKGGTFLVSDGNPVSTSDLIRVISRKLNKKVILFNLPIPIKFSIKYLFSSTYGKLWGNFYVDPTDSFNELGFTPPFTFDQGVESMVNWYLNK